MAVCGFYGKLPSEGDFVTRRLPWEFTSAWDDWLQQGMQASRAALGERWLPLYLSAPLWRFHLAPGICGPLAWRGVFFASVDRVGRYFPLTLAFMGAPAGTGRGIASNLEVDAAGWLAAEDAALSGLDPALALDAFDSTLQVLPEPASEGADADVDASCSVHFFCAATDDAPARRFAFAGLPEPAAFVDLIAPPPAAPSSPADTPGEST